MSARTISIYPAYWATFEESWILGAPFKWPKRDMMWYEIWRPSFFLPHYPTFMSRWPLLRVGGSVCLFCFGPYRNITEKRLTIVNPFFCYVSVRRLLNNYPNYSFHRLYFREVETPYTGFLFYYMSSQDSLPLSSNSKIRNSDIWFKFPLQKKTGENNLLLDAMKFLYC